MYQILLQALETRNLVFTCPVTLDNDETCNQCWDYELVRTVACLTDEERQSVERKMSKISHICSGDFQRCPSCKFVCFNEESIKRAECGMCHFQFCWSCLSEWNAPYNSDACGNAICTRQDPRLSHLAEKSEMEFMEYTGTETYKTRLCPGCSFIINFDGVCKHMTCPSCGTSFCFVCLELYNTEDGIWPCGEYDEECNMAPHQTEIPVK